MPRAVLVERIPALAMPSLSASFRSSARANAFINVPIFAGTFTMGSTMTLAESGWLAATTSGACGLNCIDVLSGFIDMLPPATAGPEIVQTTARQSEILARSIIYFDYDMDY